MYNRGAELLAKFRDEHKKMEERRKAELLRKFKEGSTGGSK